MRFQAEKKPLWAAVKAACGPIPARGTIPALECVLIRAADTLSFTGTNLDTEVTATSEAAISDRGCVAVPAKTLDAWLAAAPDALVIARLEGGRLHLSAGRATSVLPTLPEGDFPVAMPGDAPHEIIGSDLGFCEPFAARDDVRYYINGVFIGPEGTCGTDGHRMAYGPSASPAAAIIPADAIRTITAALDAGGRLFVGESVWRVERQGYRAKGKLIEGTFPDFRRLVPSDGIHMFSADADDLVRAWSQAVAGGASQALIIADGDEIAIEGHGFGVEGVASKGACRADVTAPGAMMFSAKYLGAAFAALSGATIRCDASPSAFHFRAHGRDGFGVVVLPQRDVRNAAPGQQVAA